MKKKILAFLAALAFAVPASAWELGNGISLDNELEAKYAMDAETTSITLESGISVPVWILSANVNADFDLTNLGSNAKGDVYQGIDIGIDYSVSEHMVLEVDSGIDTNGDREDIVVSMTLSF